MRLGALIRDVQSGLIRHKVRTLLILSTLTFGFASVLVTIGTVEGGRHQISGDLRALGMDVVACLNPANLATRLWATFSLERGDSIGTRWYACKTNSAPT